MNLTCVLLSRPTTPFVCCSCVRCDPALLTSIKPFSASALCSDSCSPFRYSRSPSMAYVLTSISTIRCRSGFGRRYPLDINPFASRFTSSSSRLGFPLVSTRSSRWRIIADLGTHVDLLAMIAAIGVVISSGITLVVWFPLTFPSTSIDKQCIGVFPALCSMRDGEE